MRALWPFNCLWEVPVCILWTRIVCRCSDFFKGRDGGLAASVITLRGTCQRIRGQEWRGVHTDEPLYSSNSLESSSMSVYATLMCDTGRSNDERAVIDGAKKGSLDLALSNICILASREVMGDMACWRRIRTRTSGSPSKRVCVPIGNSPWRELQRGG